MSVYFNEGGGGLSWRQQVVATTGSHNLRVADIGSDGDPDIVGANWSDVSQDSAAITLWRNDLDIEAGPAWLGASPGAVYAFSGPVGGETLTVTSGVITITDDVSSTHANLNVVVQSGATVNFSSPQRMSQLSAAGGVASFGAIAGGASKLTAAATSSGGHIELGSHGLVINYTGTSPIGAWETSSYSGLPGKIQSAALRSNLTNARSTLGIAEASIVLGLAGAETIDWNGQTADATSALIAHVWKGDTNFDEAIGGDDYFQIDSHSGVVGGSVSYFNGDFDYNGRIDADDYFLIDSNYGHAQPAAAAAAASHSGDFPALSSNSSISRRPLLDELS